VTAHDRPSKSELSARQKLILSGLYLSKFDSAGLHNLGFDSFVEAFNVIGYALGSKPASVKNYRDEFDPIFPNQRKGWHKRPIREYCREIYEHYRSLDLDEFTGLVRSFFGFGNDTPLEEAQTEERGKGASAFAQRLATGLAAERYFESVHAGLPDFQGLLLENTTRFGCGYDFRLRRELSQQDFLAVEVKGLMEQSGSVSMTLKEYDTASKLRERFFLFVVRNFRETPRHTIFQDPTSNGLGFRRTETVIVQVSWSTTV
jgi:Domain of unknown function (DUF3883)